MTGLLGLAITLALAAAAGGAANWAADVLPGRGANTDRPYCKALHYWTILWYPFRKGLCPHCAQPRPRRAPLLEVAVIIAFGVTWWRFAADPLHLAVVCLYAAFLLAVLVIDLEHRRVLNVMLAPAAVVAALLSLLPGQPGLPQALLAAGVGLGLFVLLAVLSRGAIGAGDVKLAGVIGLLVGWPHVLSALVYGIVLGGLAAAALLVMRRAGRRSYMAYAPYLALGTLIVLWLK